MTLHYLLYASKSTLAPETAEQGVRDLVAWSARANRIVDLTGALIFTGKHFAQVLEGEEAVLDAMMRSIKRDTRHEGLTIADRAEISERRFTGWSLAYLGPSQFVSRHVMQLIDQPDIERRRRASAWVADLMVEFARGA